MYILQKLQRACNCGTLNDFRIFCVHSAARRPCVLFITNVAVTGPPAHFHDLRSHFLRGCWLNFQYCRIFSSAATHDGAQTSASSFCFGWKSFCELVFMQRASLGGFDRGTWPCYAARTLSFVNGSDCTLFKPRSGIVLFFIVAIATESAL